MRVGRLKWLAPLAFVLAAAPAVAATPAPRASLLVQPARADFDQDGRTDTAAGVLTDPSIVRVTLSRTGIRDIPQPAPVVAVAGFDYDSDGDLDLLVGTSDGAILWVNDGQGVFSVFPLLLEGGPPAPSSPALTDRPVFTETFLEKHDRAISQHDRDGPRGPEVLNAAEPGSDARISDCQFSIASPRAPPCS